MSWPPKLGERTVRTLAAEELCRATMVPKVPQITIQRVEHAILGNKYAEVVLDPYRRIVHVMTAMPE